ncbi:MAG: hypothetical protein P8178_14055 [Candidatus Thiodiazotropha sp.]
MAAHKGRMADIAVRTGIRHPQALTVLPSRPGSLFELFTEAPVRRTVRVWADSAVRVTHEIEAVSDLAVRVTNHLNREPDLQLVIFGRKDFDCDTAVRIVRPVQWQFDTSIRSFGHPTVQMDTAQRITRPEGLLADARQVIFALLIGQDHEIQT